MGQIEETLQSLLSYLCACTQTCMHANINAPYVLECLEAYSGSSVFDQRCKVHNEWWRHAGHDHDNFTCVNNNAGMILRIHAILMFAQAHISAKMGQTGKVKVSI